MNVMPANKLPVPHHLNTDPQTTSTALLDTSGAQHQNPPAPPTLDFKVDQLLARARLPMGKDEAIEFAETLEKVSRSHFPPTDRISS